MCGHIRISRSFAPKRAGDEAHAIGRLAQPSSSAGSGTDCRRVQRPTNQPLRRRSHSPPAPKRLDRVEHSKRRRTMTPRRLFVKCPAVAGAAALVALRRGTHMARWRPRGGHTVIPESSKSNPNTSASALTRTSRCSFLPAGWGRRSHLVSGEANASRQRPPIQGISTRRRLRWAASISSCPRRYRDAIPTP